MKNQTGEILKTIMAIYLFRWEVDKLKNSGVDPANFSEYLYQPETGEFFHHREDHNHLLKRIVNCLREGHIPRVDLRYLRDAMHDKTTGLSYEALTGKNKQSVLDCERLISPGVTNFLDRKGQKTVAHVLNIILA